MKIGWIGLGNMGIPMVTNLLKSGYEVEVYNRTRAKAEPLLALGATFEEPHQLLQNNDVIITMLADDEAVKNVYLGTEGLLGGTTNGKIIIDMSTVSPNTSRELYKACKDVAASFLDAPVSGSVKPATEGTLIIMVGGDEEVFNKVKPIFAHLGKLALYLGESGAGSSAKLAINLLLGITVQGIAESVLFAEKQGIKLEDMLTIITESAVGTAISKIKAPSILNRDYPAAFALKHMAKDLRLAHEISDLSPISETTHRTYQDALRDGLGELDVMAVLKYLERD